MRIGSILILIGFMGCTQSNRSGANTCKKAKSIAKEAKTLAEEAKNEVSLLRKELFPGEARPAVGAKRPHPRRVPMKSLIVNLNEPRSTRYLKVTLSVELSGSISEEDFQARVDVVRSSLLTFLSGLTIDDLRGDMAKTTIRQSLVTRINQALGPQKGAQNVYFTEFVVQ